jgi:hypothetical protein
MRQTGSGLEEEWLRFLDQHDLRLPDRAQLYIAECQTRPDFLYDGDYNAAIYVDGPVHDDPMPHARDVAQTDAMEDRGYTVIRFGHRDDWLATVRHYPSIFGKEHA